MSISFHAIYTLVYASNANHLHTSYDSDGFFVLEICRKQISSVLDTKLISPLHPRNITNFLKMCKTPFYSISITKLYSEGNGLLPASVYFIYKFINRSEKFRLSTKNRAIKLLSTYQSILCTANVHVGYV